MVDQLSGIADEHDQWRTQYLLAHLGVIAKMITKGVDIRGYYHWSLMDNFEWSKGFGPRFGLLKIDYKTYQRQKTKSAEVYQKVIEAHRTQKTAPREDLLRNFK